MIKQLVGWATYAIENLLVNGKLYIGDGYRAKNSELARTGIPFARVGNINNGFQFQDADHFPIKDLFKVGVKVGEPGDVVFTSKGTVGRFALVKNTTERFVYSPQLSFWRVLDQKLIEPQFLYYWMYGREFRQQFYGVKSQTDMADYVSLYDQRQMHITLPPLPEQRAIAHILGSLDDKIELNRQMNATLESLARAIFKSWFVDFDPVYAKANGEPPAGMDAATAALFPDGFVESELGMIPKGWRIGTVGEDFNITMGQSPPGETYNEEGDGLPFYQGRRDFGFRYPDVRVYCNSPTRFAKSGDTLVSVRAPVGDINMADEDCCIGRGVAAIRHKTGSRSYTYYAMQSLQNIFGKFETEGTVFGSLNKQDFHNIEFLIPPFRLVEKFELTVFAVDQIIEMNTQQSRTLAELRDTLLPKLISGEVRVPDAERIVGRCV